MEIQPLTTDMSKIIILIDKNQINDFKRNLFLPCQNN
jgi:hypothetical protein